MTRIALSRRNLLEAGACVLTKNGKSFRNVEYFRFRNEKVEAIESYFGEQSSFPSAVSSGQR